MRSTSDFRLLYSESIILYYIIIWHKYAYMPIYIYILICTKMYAIRGLQKVDWLQLCIYYIYIYIYYIYLYSIFIIVVQVCHQE